jgi:hypothetical protein
LGGGGESFEELHLASGEQSDRQAVAIEKPVTGKGGKLWSGSEDAGEVERICTGERDPNP